MLAFKGDVCSHFWWFPLVSACTIPMVILTLWHALLLLISPPPSYQPPSQCCAPVNFLTCKFDSGRVFFPLFLSKLRFLHIPGPTRTWSKCGCTYGDLEKTLQTHLDRATLSDQRKDGSAPLGKAERPRSKQDLKVFPWPNTLHHISLDSDPLVTAHIFLHCIFRECPNLLLWTLQFFILRLHVCACLLPWHFSSTQSYRAIHQLLW